MKLISHKTFIRRWRIPQFYIFHSTFYILSASDGLRNPPKCGQNLFLPNKPNFHKSGQPVTLDMLRTYNDNFPEKHKKNKPKTAQK